MTREATPWDSSTGSGSGPRSRRSGPPRTSGRYGRAGRELLLRRLVGSSSRFKDAHLLPGRRIPSKRQGRRREIDLIVCTPQTIQLIEVKNWSGRLTVRDGAWRQTRRAGDVVDHGDLLRENRLKRDAVVEYLHDRGLVLDEAFVRRHIVPIVIFTNPNLELDPEVEARPDVISRRELDGYVGGPRKTGLGSGSCRPSSRSASTRGPNSARPSLKSLAGGFPPPVRENRLLPFGGRDLGPASILRDEGRHGGRGGVEGRHEDVPQAGTGGDVGTLADPPPVDEGEILGARQGPDRARVAREHDLGKSRFPVSTADTVMFHAAGDVESRPRRLVELGQIVLG